MANKTGGIRSIPYHCPNCGGLVGQLIEVNGWARLDDGEWVIGDGTKHCHRCGCLVHFKAPKESWMEVVARYVQRLERAAGDSTG